MKAKFRRNIAIEILAGFVIVLASLTLIVSIKSFAGLIFAIAASLILAEILNARRPKHEN